LASHLLRALCGIVLRFIARLSTREAQTWVRGVRAADAPCREGLRV